jgi:trans-aconitate 2-methyltransferase
MSDTWNPQQYAQFARERSQPFYDLLALVQPRDGMRVIDLGCGSGELTRHLHEHLRASHTIGLDKSGNMLAQASKHASDGLEFRKGDIATLHTQEKFELVFSNAALQWVPNPTEVLARLSSWLTDEGQLAVQVPANDDHATHVVAREIASRSPYREALTDWSRQFFVLKPEDYAAFLNHLGFRQQHVRLQVYGHLLPSRDDEIEWVKGTMLTDYQRQMPPEMFAKFIEDYRRELLPRLDDDRPHFYPFKRILFWARR